jgi:precorrin-2 methylase
MTSLHLAYEIVKHHHREDLARARLEAQVRAAYGRERPRQVVARWLRAVAAQLEDHTMPRGGPTCETAACAPRRTA